MDHQGDAQKAEDRQISPFDPPRAESAGEGDAFPRSLQIVCLIAIYALERLAHYSFAAHLSADPEVSHLYLSALALAPTLAAPIVFLLRPNRSLLVSCALAVLGYAAWIAPRALPDASLLTATVGVLALARGLFVTSLFLLVAASFVQKPLGVLAHRRDATFLSLFVVAETAALAGVLPNMQTVVAVPVASALLMIPATALSFLVLRTASIKQPPLLKKRALLVLAGILLLVILESRLIDLFNEGFGNAAIPETVLAALPWAMLLIAVRWYFFSPKTWHPARKARVGAGGLALALLMALVAPDSTAFISFALALSVLSYAWLTPVALSVACSISSYRVAPLILGLYFALLRVGFGLSNPVFAATEPRPLLLFALLVVVFFLGVGLHLASRRPVLRDVRSS